MLNGFVRMKISTYFFLGLFVISNSSFSQGPASYKAIDSTSYLIKSNKDSADNFVNGPMTKTIAENVWKIVYDSNSTYSDSIKLRMVFLMLLNQEYSSRYYRAMLFDKVLKGDSLVLSKPEFVIPFIFCSYCHSSNVLAALKNGTYKNLRLTNLPMEYRKVYQFYQVSIEDIDLSLPDTSKLNADFRHIRFFINLNQWLLN
jgi:hypothetical protein